MVYIITNDKQQEILKLIKEVKGAYNQNIRVQWLNALEASIQNLNQVEEEENPDPELYWKSGKGYILYTDMDDDHVVNAVVKQAAKGVVTAPLVDEYIRRGLFKRVRKEMINILITAEKFEELLQQGLVEGYEPPVYHDTKLLAKQKQQRKVERKYDYSGLY
jgi:hypothetical protein